MNSLLHSAYPSDTTKGVHSKLLIVQLLLLMMLAGCESAYYGAMEKVGYHKRDILIDRIQDTQEAQRDGQEQFKNALEAFQQATDFDGGELETVYKRLNSEYEASASAADEIRQRIGQVESVSEALFDEWEEELSQYSSTGLRQQSKRQLQDTQRRYQTLIRKMRQAEKRMEPVLATFLDNVLYLKHNLNAQAISSLKKQLHQVDSNISELIKSMQESIAESEAFIKETKRQG